MNANEDDEIIKDFLIECNEHLDLLDTGFVAIEQDYSDYKTLSAIFRSIHTIKGGAGMLGFHKLEKLSHAAENLLSSLRDGKLMMNTHMTTVLLQTVDAIRYMLECIAQTSEDGEEEFLELIEILHQLLTNPNEAIVSPSKSKTESKTEAKKSTNEKYGENNEPQYAELTEEVLFEEHIEMERLIPPISVEMNSAENEAPNVQVASEHSLALESRNLQSTEASIRINIDLLDKLMNLVGELVLSRNQVLQCISTQSDSNFIAVSQRLNLITSELQEGVMKTRMQPIGNVWSKFTRVVRDLSISLNKKVNLEMYGKETELDKTLIEAIKDPLIHIIRNSLDHGIEMPADRLAAGKSEEGTLTLKAYHESGHVHIEVTDDGHGIAPDKVKNKALSKGLISAEQAARMSEHDALNLIFLPGLSTAETITNVSGRGVGMDVVKTNIERINGTIDLQSVIGHSTSLKIKIPLTLAIIPALIITCCTYRYAIPQVSLLELVRLEANEVNQNIQFIMDTPIYKLRGKLLPLVYLSKEFNLTVEGNQEVQDDSVNIVVLQAGEMQFGLVVDCINDTQEIVVKPLNKLLKNLSIYSGATIMGDGNVSLILDPMGLARKAGLLAAQAQADKLKEINSANTNMDKRQTLLLLRSGESSLMAVPLSKVERIEEFLVVNIETAGHQEVVQYRNSIMPLVWLNRSINTQSMDTLNIKDKVQVIVYSQDDKNVGIVVDHVYDIVEGVFTLHEKFSQVGVIGTAIIEDKVTEVIDIENIIHTVLPHYFDKHAVI
ncbi:MAG: chemotaxis protein CheW [Legionella sp.]|nr:chemotaxis protein CheW [Legionella sp.]